MQISKSPSPIATRTARPFGAFFYGEFGDNFDDEKLDDKNNNKFNDRHMFTNQENYEMRDDYMQFDFFIGLKCNSLKRKQMGSLGKQCSIVRDDTKRVEMGGKNASGVCVSAHSWAGDTTPLYCVASRIFGSVDARKSTKGEGPECYQHRGPSRPPKLESLGSLPATGL